LKPRDSFWEYGKSEAEYSVYCPEMVVIPPGTFMMGSAPDDKQAKDNEHPQHEVTIGERFAVSRFEVTFHQWDNCVAYGACNRSGEQWGRGKQPAIYVSWDDAQQYVRWLSGLTGKKYRLLSEAEWEYAARAGSTSAYPFGDDPSMLDEYAWQRHNSDEKAHPVDDNRKPNQFGLYNMHGNVWEWVEDCYHKYTPTDGPASTTGDCNDRVARGGSWYGMPADLRSARRDENPASYRENSLGFRVGRTLSAGDGTITVAPGAH
jgi:formylglycine-generating enzyme required for sulfatase activity